MGPVSSGFTEVRSLFDKEVNEIIQNFQKTNDTTKLKEVRQNATGALHMSTRIFYLELD